MPSPRIIPVLDVLHGQVVRAVGGLRGEYRPIVSRITTSTEPLRVARDLLAATGARELYVADLDAIGGGEFSEATRELLNTIDVPVWLDCGIRKGVGSRSRDGNDSRPLFPSTVRPVVGFESAESPDVLSEACSFSLDLWNGELFGPWQSWGVESSRDLFGVLDRVFAKGVRSLIVLDLTAVGANEGPTTLALCRRIRERYPALELLTGGGVRNASDLARLGEVGVDGALVASAIHDGVHFTIDTSA
jgi:phosphoribosylformimino-5-aminoimidazole carboxamide ribotide isomerase